MDAVKLQEHNDLCVGIDLGTTNSVLATINERPNGDVVSKVVEIARAVDMYNAVSGEPKLTKMKKPILPSCVYYRQENNYEPLVGDFAKMQYPLRPHLVAKSIKSQMGKPLAENLSEDIPDKTPAQISSRILKHLLREASKIYRCEITDAVITVPANFDSAMCKSTLDAAKLAGIRVTNSDGSERPVLLSEPNAVIYDLMNQIHNGEIQNRILDLSRQNTVLVFDLGGGTLDITMHQIRRREDNPQVLKVDEIATNRYTLLGGDDFDEEIARAMYQRYLSQYAKYPDVVQRLKKEEPVILPQLRVYAEHLKLELNERCGDDYDSEWDDPEEEISLPTGGNMGGIGYSYDDTFTQKEVEEILAVFMARELVYDDYKRIDQIHNTRNIIYPILDVLKKAAAKLGTPDVKVDAVIVNGGMSKFYMVTDRLKGFFGFDPIVALDPDQAVARGASIYHYYLHKYEEMQDDMRHLENEDPSRGVENNAIGSKSPSPQKRGIANSKEPSVRQVAIQWGNTILNDSLYLGIKNGAVHEIIPTGAELPYASMVMTGFKLEPGQKKISIPIKSQNLNGSYRIIASGNILFRQTYENGAFVAFQIYMNSSKVITMKAWTSRDIGGREKIEEGGTEIAIENGERILHLKAKILGPSGSILRPKPEINHLIQLCQNFEKCNDKTQKSNISKRISLCVSNISTAGNASEFGTAILDALERTSCQEARQRLFILSRRIGLPWSESEKNRLALACIDQLQEEMRGSSKVKGTQATANIQAIYTLGMCANMKQIETLKKLHNKPRYVEACLSAHAKTRSQVQWICSRFESDVRKHLKGQDSQIQASSHAVGIALMKRGLKKPLLSASVETKVVKNLCDVIANGKLISVSLLSCILALGLICDQREIPSGINGKVIQRACNIIQNLDTYYSPALVKNLGTYRKILLKMINGSPLDAAEERFLLEKIG